MVTAYTEAKFNTGGKAHTDFLNEDFVCGLDFSFENVAQEKTQTTKSKHKIV